MCEKTSIHDEWLESSPLPVVGRIINSVNDLRFLGISADIYQQDTIVVIPLETLQRLIESMNKS